MLNCQSFRTSVFSVRENLVGPEIGISSGGSEFFMLRESIIDPQAKIRQGYQPVMPTFKGILSDDEIGYVTEYIKTLK